MRRLACFRLDRDSARRNAEYRKATRHHTTFGTGVETRTGADAEAARLVRATTHRATRLSSSSTCE
jgi:hypothetical protein